MAGLRSPLWRFDRSSRRAIPKGAQENDTRPHGFARGAAMYPCCGLSQARVSREGDNQTCMCIYRYLPGSPAEGDDGESRICELIMQTLMWKQMAKDQGPSCAFRRRGKKNSRLACCQGCMARTMCWMMAVQHCNRTNIPCLRPSGIVERYQRHDFACQNDYVVIYLWPSVGQNLFETPGISRSYVRHSTKCATLY